MAGSSGGLEPVFSGECEGVDSEASSEADGVGL